MAFQAISLKLVISLTIGAPIRTFRALSRLHLITTPR